MSELEDLLVRMERAVLAHDVAEVQRLTAAQQACVSELAEAAKRDLDVREQLRRSAPELQNRLRQVLELLQQGIDLADAAVRALYHRSQSEPNASAPARVTYLA
ncbi:MAG: hypothetical protein K6T81_08155 [Alicyclobacillus macrosporangiidus]|uniref:hypothetical protein n=1 Tax=Alicyclobacillus macrosporangiidus TaxID=392015 RepID=UPI0026EC7C02|nr:hypothetical protein [Alicyclobacillus macrosporangiidus]MCL6598699.1 hypothetical protein [Alicyclobacillus macrosporangiidus]